MGEKQYFAVIGDIIGSRNVDDRAGLQRQLNAGLADVNRQYADQIASQYLTEFSLRSVWRCIRSICVSGSGWADWSPRCGSRPSAWMVPAFSVHERRSRGQRNGPHRSKWSAARLIPVSRFTACSTAVCVEVGPKDSSRLSTSRCRVWKVWRSPGYSRSASQR